MENTRIKKIGQSRLALNVVKFLFKQDTTIATKYLLLHRIPFRIMKSGEGYWLNVSWKCGLIAALTRQELDQLPDYNQQRKW